jgi:TolB-like protein
VEQPAAEDVREHLGRILRSHALSGSERRRAFLRYVVEETLAGRARQLKGFSVAVAVFGRDESFDSQSDPVVRLEALRLRQELEHYYLTEGASDTIQITIPKGAYIPAFSRVDPPPEPADALAGTEPQDEEVRFNSARALRIGVTVSVALALVLLGVRWLTLDRAPRPETQVAGAPPPSFETPVVAVLPLQSVGSDFPVEDLARALNEDIVTDLSRFTGLRVIAYGSSSRSGAPDHLDVRAIGTALGASHLLAGTFQTDGETYRVNMRLLDVTSQQQIWADRFEYTHDGILATQGEISATVAAALSVELRPAERVSAGAGLKTMAARSLYQQALILIHPPYEPSRFVASRALLARVIQLEPDAADGYAGLAFIEANSIWFGHAEDRDAALDEVQGLASKALAIDRANAQALLAQGITAILHGEYDQAIDRCRTATALRPSDSRAFAYLGATLVFVGRAAEAIPYIERALRLDPTNPRTPYLNMLGIAYFHAGNNAAALVAFQRNVERRGPFGPHMLTWTAAAHSALGNTTAEEAVLAKLRGSPDASWVAGWLTRSFRDHRDIAPLLAALARAGQLDAGAQMIGHANGAASGTVIPRSHAVR